MLPPMWAFGASTSRSLPSSQRAGAHLEVSPHAHVDCCVDQSIPSASFGGSFDKLAPSADSIRS
jgi:hypothetical protein